MSIKSFINSIFGSAQTHPAVAAAPATTVAALKAFGGSEAAKVVAALKETDIGTAVANDVSALTNSTLTGAQKFEQVVASATPLVLKYATGGGIAALEADVVGITRALVQTIYTDIADTGFGKIAGEFLKWLGI